MITVDYLKSILDLDYETGFLYWKKRDTPGSWNARHAGKRAGSPKHRGYRMVRIDGRAHIEHRIVFAIANRALLPDGVVIDHINGDRSDNRPLNLQAITNKENVRKRHRLGRNNTSGVIGVIWSRGARKWQASIVVDGRDIYLGLFERKGDAVKARRTAEVEHFGEFAPNVRG